MQQTCMRMPKKAYNGTKAGSLLFLAVCEPSVAQNQGVVAF
jgi:hypothetical protein